MSRVSVSVSALVVAALLALMAPAPASGLISGTYDKLTYLTFSGPVQIPGVTLNAGTYKFRLANPETNRNVLQVLSNDGTIVYAMFHTIPDHRTSLTEESIVTFRETPVGVPPAVKSLFYGGEYRGYEFVYPKGEPNLIAEVVPQPPITYTAMPPEVVPELVLEPKVEPVAPPAVVAAAPEPPPAPELPKTASMLPFMALGGLSLLVAGLGLGLARR